MVDVGDKLPMRRQAVARGRVLMDAATRRSLESGTVPKGDVLAAARIAGIMAAKQTSALIPLCHQLPLDAVEVDFAFDDHSLLIEARARVQARTGVEMEALTAVAVAALTVYDMCKAVDRTMVIDNIRLVEKTGGKTAFRRPGEPGQLDDPGPDR
jgi:cyclic pyranopterin phosphate synthase